jgi:hypothetical protein
MATTLVISSPQGESLRTVSTNASDKARELLELVKVGNPTALAAGLDHLSANETKDMLLALALTVQNVLERLALLEADRRGG